MTRSVLSQLLAIAGISLASCGYLGGSHSGGTVFPDPNAILQFQSSGEQLALPGLQVGSKVYTNVALRLGKDGSWSLQSVGAARPLAVGESVQAVLAAPGDTAIDTSWRPADATITIRRLHIDAKVYGSVGLRLTGNTWSWQTTLQELSALTQADFNANPSLVASETHHVVLQSSPENGTQSYPLKLASKVYKFCMDAQDEGADTLRLLDATGKEVFNLKAGDPCVDIDAGAGLYTVQHSYGGAGSKRMVFVHPAAAAAAAAAPATLAATRSSAPRVLAASDPNHPEYWSVYYVDNSGANGYLTFTGTNDFGGAWTYPTSPDPNTGVTTPYYTFFGCQGQIQAVARTVSYWWPQDKTTRSRYLFDAANFFEISRSSDGTPSTFGLPLDCISWPPLNGSGQSVDPAHHFYAFDSSNSDPNYVGPFWIVAMRQYQDEAPTNYVAQYLPVNNMAIANFSNNAFQLNAITGGGATLGVTLFNNFLSVWEFATPNSIAPLYYLVCNTESGNGCNSGTEFHVGFRYFPAGLPPSMADSSGAWTLAKGEVAMFSGPNCSGAAMISEGLSLPYPQPDTPIAELAILGGFAQSLQLGPDTAAAVYSGYLYQGESKVFNQLGCLSFGDAGFAPGSIRVSTDSASIVVQTNRCEYCNLAGIDMSNLDISNDVKLQHSNLTGAQLSNSNLSNADLRFATLQGALLNYANLESANLCQAALNAGHGGAAASLSGAHLKNANLSGADLDGANFSYASFYSDTPQSCQSACDTYTKPVCASAYGASMDSARFPNAYLAGVDMSGANANGTEFSGAMLFGALLRNAKFNRSAATGTSTDFGYAFLQGADFTDAQVRDASFTNAYVDSDPNAGCIQAILANEHTGFPGLLASNPNPAPQCIAGTQSVGTCIQYIYGSAHWPVTDASNSCPNGSAGPCTTASWTSPGIPQASSVQQTSSCPPAATALCDGFIAQLNSCW